MSSSTKNLMFLLGTAPMSLAGCLGDEINDTLSTLTGASTTFTTTQTNGETGDGDGDSGDGDGAPGDGDGAPGDGDGAPGDGDGDGAPGDGDGAPGDGDGSPGDGDGDIDDSACGPYAEFYAMCYGAEYEAAALAYCQESFQYASMYGLDCIQVFEAYLVCVTQLSCEDFQMTPPVGCEAELQAIMDTCQ